CAPSPAQYTEPGRACLAAPRTNTCPAHAGSFVGSSKERPAGFRRINQGAPTASRGSGLALDRLCRLDQDGVTVRIRDLLDLPGTGLELLHAEPADLDRPLRWVVTTDLPDPGRYLTGGELVLTGM